MKKFKEDIKEDFEEDVVENEKVHASRKSGDASDEEVSYKRMEDEEREDDFMTPSMKSFRRLTGVLVLAFFAYFMIFVHGSGTTSYKSGLQSGRQEGVKVGDRLSKDAVKLEAKDISIDSANGYGKIELSIWNFSDKEDGDYVQVFVDGAPQTEPFSIRHKPVKVGVPDKAVIQVKGIRDGSNNGITYGVSFSKTGETYLNTVPLNAANTYTVKTAQ